MGLEWKDRMLQRVYSYYSSSSGTVPVLQLTNRGSWHVGRCSSHFS